MIPGEYVLGAGSVTMNAGREAIDVVVTNTGDRPVQVGSHYHFAEANPALVFDRQAAYGRRLDIPAGTAARFEPGDAKTVRADRTRGQPGGPRPQQCGERKARRRDTRRRGRERAVSFELSRRQYADLYGPTTGDAIRLADTELFLEIEKDFTVYGEEVVFGGGKVIRDGMGQNGQATRDGASPAAASRTP